MPPTHDLTDTGAGLPALQKGRTFVLKRTVSFATYNCEAGETIDLFDIPANCLVRTFINRRTPEGAGCTIDLGVTDATACFFDDLDVNATGVAYGDAADGDEAVVELMFVAATTMTLTANSAGSNAAVFDVYAVITDLAS